MSPLRKRFKDPQENIVAREQYSRKTKEIRAQDLYELTQETLQSHWHLDMESSRYEAEDLWYVL